MNIENIGQKEFKKGVEVVSGIHLVTIVIPAFNEEQNLGRFQASFERQKNNLCKIFPNVQLTVVISDNGSTDTTREKAEKFATVTTGSIPRSRGSARNVGFETALAQNTGDPKGQILISMDADTVIDNDEYLSSICEAFSKDLNLMASYGPYAVELTRGRTVTIPAVVSNYMRRKKVLDRFKIFDRDIEDFMHQPYSQLFPGFNFAMRAEAYQATNGFPNDPSLMDDYLVSLELKRRFNSSQILFNRKQKVITSGRALETPEGKLSLRKISAKIRGRYASYGETEIESKENSPSAKALKTFIDATERVSYGLTDTQHILAVVTQAQLNKMAIPRTGLDIRPAINHTTGEVIQGKYALISR